MDLRTDYKDDILDTSVNEKRVYNLIDQSGNVVMSGLSLEDVTVYSQVGDEFSSSAVNEAFNNINNRNLKTYTSLSQLGLSINTVTSPDTIPLALGGNAILTMQIGNTDATTLYNNGIIPKSYGGSFTVVNSGWRSSYQYIPMGIYSAIYRRDIYNYITSSPITWSDWRKIDAYIELTGTLASGETTITLTDDAITTGSKFDFYTSIYGVSPVSAPIVTTGSITLEFDAQETDMNVEVRVM